MQHAVFPTQVGQQQAPGLTKRELIAAMAMQGMLSDRSTMTAYGDAARGKCIEPEVAAAAGAVAMADALLAELAKDGAA